MTEEPTTPELNPEQNDEKNDSGWGATQMAVVAIGVYIGLILLVFVIGLVAAAVFDDSFGNIIRVVRDLVIIVITLEGVLVGVAFIVFVIQLARLVNLLKSESKPILENTQDAAYTLKGTADFVSNNAARPLIRILSFFSGVRVFLRDLGGIRRAVRRSDNFRKNGKK